MSTLKNEQKIRTEISMENGVKWIRHYRKRPTEDKQQRLAPPLYKGTYKCDRCGHIWEGVSGSSPPLHDIECTYTYCGNPSLIRTMVRQLKKQQIGGVGRLVEIEAWLWDVK